CLIGRAYPALTGLPNLPLPFLNGARPIIAREPSGRFDQKLGVRARDGAVDKATSLISQHPAKSAAKRCRAESDGSLVRLPFDALRTDFHCRDQRVQR